VDDDEKTELLGGALATLYPPSTSRRRSAW
jgi:hypothetical protein